MMDSLFYYYLLMNAFHSIIKLKLKLLHTAFRAEADPGGIA